MAVTFMPLTPKERQFYTGPDNVDVMKKALDINIAAEGKELPIHYCAKCDGSKCLKLLLKLVLSFMPRQARENRYFTKQSAVEQRITLPIWFKQVNSSVKDKKLKYLAYEEISALAEPDVIIASSAPVAFAVELTEVFKKCADRNEVHRQQLLELTQKMEQLAVDIIEIKGSGYILHDDVIFKALDNDLKKVYLFMQLIV